MPDILGGSYYGTETVSSDAPGGAWDSFVGYDSYAPADGYIQTGADLFDNYGQTIEWGGGSDPYQSAASSSSDIIRSRAAGTPYPASPINTVPPQVGSDSESKGFGSDLFKSVVGIFGKAAVTLAGTVGAQALASTLGGERSVPGRPSYASTRPGSPTGLPARPFVLPSFLGGGTFSPTSSSTLFLVIAAAAGFFVLLLFARR